MSMKKTISIIIAAIAMLCLGNKLSAQTSIGLYSGARAYVDIFNGDTDNKESDAAYAVGLSFEQNARLAKIFGVSVGADLGLVAMNEFKGVKDASFLESYLDIPVRAKVFIPFGSAVDFSIFAGGAPSFCLSSNTKVGDADPIKNLSDNGYQSFDMMIGGGIGLDIISHIKLALSFDFGLLDRNKSDIIETHSGVLKFKAAYVF